MEISGEQLKTYDTIIPEVKNAPENNIKVVLPSHLKLRQANIHQYLLHTSPFKNLSQNISKLHRFHQKLTLYCFLLNEIKQRQENDLIFSTSKSV